MAVLSPADRKDVDRVLGHLLELHRDRAITTQDAKALLTRFIDEIDRQDVRAAQNMWHAMAALSGGGDA